MQRILSKERIPSPGIKNGRQKTSHDTDNARLQATVIDVAVKGLPTMFDEKNQLFCKQIIRTEKKCLISEGLNYRYSMITLLGLHKYEASGGISPIDAQTTLQRLVESADTIKNCGDVGLLLWLCALADPVHLDFLYTKLGIANIFDIYPDAVDGYSMSLGWLLTGASYAAMAENSNPRWQQLAEKTYQQLLENYHGKGIFRHQSPTTIKGFLRGRFGSFADQVYPTYGLVAFATAFDNDEAINIASKCAETIIRHQGILGQWWWQYNAATGRKAGKYPVFATHQNGMAPMMLFAAGKAAGEDFRPAIYKGLRWLDRKNELGVNMIDADEHLIWRCIHKNPNQRYWDGFRAVLGLSTDIKHTELQVKFECRPYHLGWILYAFASESEIV